MNDLPNMLGTSQVLEPVRAQIDQPHRRRKVVSDERSRRPGHQDLTPMRDRPKTSAPIQDLTGIAAVVA
jgi:hypothetical protein